jgi:mannose-6-phosphate isomerase-like protein (cupin superfamily)
MAQDFDIKNGSIENLIRRGADSVYTGEYNCRLRRLFPWPNHVDTKRQLTEFGCVWVIVDPNTSVDRHAHDEEEAFIVISGSAELMIGSEEARISAGDVVYIPRLVEHQIRNISNEISFSMLDVYWDEGGKSHSAF